jgi:predicted ferric reductase
MDRRRDRRDAFLSWIRGIEEALDRDVHFFYSVAHAADALHRDELDAAAAAHHSLHLHYVYSATDGLLTAERVMGVLPAGASPWIYMCGPAAMTRSLAKGFRRSGIPGRHIRSEDFGAR